MDKRLSFAHEALTPKKGKKKDDLENDEGGSSGDEGDAGGAGGILSGFKLPKLGGLTPVDFAAYRSKLRAHLALKLGIDIGAQGWTIEWEPEGFPLPWSATVDLRLHSTLTLTAEVAESIMKFDNNGSKRPPTGVRALYNLCVFFRQGNMMMFSEVFNKMLLYRWDPVTGLEGYRVYQAGYAALVNQLELPIDPAQYRGDVIGYAEAVKNVLCLMLLARGSPTHLPGVSQLVTARCRESAPPAALKVCQDIFEVLEALQLQGESLRRPGAAPIGGALGAAAGNGSGAGASAQQPGRQPTPPRQPKTCFRCGLEGHVAPDCKEAVGQPGWQDRVPDALKGKVADWMAKWKKNNNNAASIFYSVSTCVLPAPGDDGSHVLTITLSANEAIPFERQAVLDTGCTGVLVHDLALLTDPTPVEEAGRASYLSASRQVLYPTHRGTLKLRVFLSDGRTHELAIHGAEHVPGLPITLVGLHPLERAGHHLVTRGVGKYGLHVPHCTAVVELVRSGKLLVLPLTQLFPPPPTAGVTAATTEAAQPIQDSLSAGEQVHEPDVGQSEPSLHVHQATDHPADPTPSTNEPHVHYESDHHPAEGTVPENITSATHEDEAADDSSVPAVHPGWGLPRGRQPAPIDADLAHRRLGHLGGHQLKRVEHAVHNFRVHGQRTTHPCPSCSLCKSKQLPIRRGVHEPRSNGPRQVVHVDLLGRKVPSRGGNEYALFGTDDYSDMIYCFLSSTRAATALVRMLEQLRLELGHHDGLPPLHLIGDAEFDCAAVHEWALANNVVFTITASREHHANGKAERANQTVWRTATTLLRETGLDASFWPYAVMHATHLAQRVPTRGQTRTPWELDGRGIPDLSHLRVFGCLVYVHEGYPDGARPLKRDGSDLARLGVYLGPVHRATWGTAHVYMLDTHQFVARASFRADESVFPSPDADVDTLLRLLHERARGSEPTGLSPTPRTDPVYDAVDDSPADDETSTDDGTQWDDDDSAEQDDLGLTDLFHPAPATLSLPPPESEEGLAPPAPADAPAATAPPPPVHPSDGQEDREEGDRGHTDLGTSDAHEKIQAHSRLLPATPSDPPSAPSGSRYWSVASHVPLDDTVTGHRYREGSSYNYTDIHPAHVLPDGVTRTRRAPRPSDDGALQLLPLRDVRQRCAPVTERDALPILTSLDLRGMELSMADLGEELILGPDLAHTKIYDPTPYTDPVVEPLHDGDLRHLSARDQSLWAAARLSEWHGMADVNHTFDDELVPEAVARQEGSILGFLWVYTKKADHRLKARLTCRGDQEDGHEAGAWAAPMITYVLLLLLLKVGLMRQWCFAVLDVQQAFLKADITRPVFMRPPPEAKAPRGHVLRIRKSLYGLGDAALQWFLLLRRLLLEYGLQQNPWHPCVFSNTELLVGVFVDDMPVFGATYHAVDKLRTFLEERTVSTTIQTTSGRLLGMGFTYDDGAKILTLDFLEYERALLARFEVPVDSRPRRTPMSADLHLVRTATRESHPRYREAVGCLLHLCKIRFDLNNSVRTLCRFSDYNGPQHWHAVQHVLHYIKGTLGQTLTLRGDCQLPHRSLIVYSDASWGDDHQDRRGTSGMVLLYGGEVFHASSRTQSVVARSSCESELMAMNEASSEVLFLRRVLAAMGEDMSAPTPVLSDSQSAIALTARPFMSARSRHIDMRRIGIRQLLDEGVVSLHWVNTASMWADIQTKNLRVLVFQRLAPCLSNHRDHLLRALPSPDGATAQEEGCWSFWFVQDRHTGSDRSVTGNVKDGF